MPHEVVFHRNENSLREIRSEGQRSRNDSRAVEDRQRVLTVADQQRPGNINETEEHRTFLCEAIKRTRSSLPILLGKYMEYKRAD